MSLSRELLQRTFDEMGLEVESDGENFLHNTRGRYAPAISIIVTPDEDSSGATIMAALTGKVTEEKRTTVCELLNLVHGQSLWNVRFHLDETGRVLAIGKHLLWGRAFNATQFGDIFFSLLVTTDRLYPCLSAILQDDSGAEDAFERFFLKREDPLEDAPDAN